MASRSPASEPARTARLYLVTPCTADPAALADRVAAVLAVAEVAAVLVPLTQRDDERTLLNGLKALAATVQNAGAALLIGGHPDLVARAGADGAHLDGIDEFESAVSSLKPERIAGCGGLATRHDAMTAAEAGADYVMFGEPEADGHRPSRDAVAERIAWWAEVFEIPCVAFAATLDEISALAATGADFIAVGDAIFDDPRGPAAAAQDAAARLAVAEPVP